MIKRIGVIGAGQMGSGIAHVCALKGFDIRLADVDQPHLDKGLDAIGRNMDRQIGRGAACHTGRRSCFYRRVDKGRLVFVDQHRFFDPKAVYPS